MLKLFQTPYTEYDFPPIGGEGGHNDDFAFYLVLIFIVMFLYFVIKGGAGR
jgi:hypothetical protein|tara:strand:+ start:653 stop:805 length:153 start_codon:yes stop_codon:yes gene_type:complete